MWTYNYSGVDTTDSSQELKHYGVLGMKWGVRKDESPNIGGSGSGLAGGANYSNNAASKKAASQTAGMSKKDISKAEAQWEKNIGENSNKALQKVYSLPNRKENFQKLENDIKRESKLSGPELSDEWRRQVVGMFNYDLYNTPEAWSPAGTRCVQVRAVQLKNEVALEAHIAKAGKEKR